MKDNNRYGDLLEKAQKRAEERETAMLENINGVIEWGKQSARERDEEWLQKERFRNDMLERAKKKIRQKI